MYSVLQRLNVLSTFALSVVSVLMACVALSGMQIGKPSAQLNIRKADVVYGRARNNADHRVQHFLETRFDINIDTTPLFNWNTKQVFLSLTASYDLPEHGRTDVVIWDRIVRDKDTARVKRKNVRNKYGMRELSRSFENVTSVDLRVEWNVMPYVGIMQRGVTPRSEPFAIAQDPELKMRPPVILPY